MAFSFGDRHSWHVMILMSLYEFSYTLWFEEKLLLGSWFLLHKLYHHASRYVFQHSKTNILTWNGIRPPDRAQEKIKRDIVPVQEA